MLAICQCFAGISADRNLLLVGFSLFSTKNVWVELCKHCPDSF